ncbi:type VII toxin-antitoxin system MntA family adenylyltransferase antitoxin [Pyrobaculum aerophilum]|uniref:DNA polymerase III subunit beta n=1 Tax=Pyrobaculum aerophilum TaxID=13773 RepID=A0A371QYA2_9CREN|nr:nucleotidyltransferase domain-containing protein [Pyrobaculum aerophilum]RFA95636.1 DNA polymerase III subunit beta [Pyrobaculum aerophilum]RFA96333.1 DNA polymerase III subunit beta [Pyrobaculum aerophilum]
MRIFRILEDAERRLKRIEASRDEDVLRWNIYAAIQDVLDVLAIIFSEEGGLPLTAAREAEERGVIPEGFVPFVKIRNALAHAYREIKKELTALRGRVLEKFPLFLSALRSYVSARGIDPVVEWSSLAYVFKRWGVKFAYLFGSRARGLEREDSDWDVAVYFGREVTIIEEAELGAELSKRLGVEVDVVALDNAPLDLIYIVLRDGVVIYSEDEKLRKQWEIETYLEYLDYASDYLE